MPFSTHVRTIDDLHGPAGRLEALLNTGHPDAPFAAVLAHPHPLFGGTMHNKVIYHAMKALSGLGLAVLRFNFRGAGLSEGTHDHGRGEIDDVRAAIDYAATRLPETTSRPILFAGFSFGSNVGLQAVTGDSRVVGAIGLGLPVEAAGRGYTYGFLAHLTQPKLFVSGDHDEFCPPQTLADFLALAPDPKHTVIIPGADHFFQGIASNPGSKLAQMQSALEHWTASTFSITGPGA